MFDHRCGLARSLWPGLVLTGALATDVRAAQVPDRDTVVFPPPNRIAVRDMKAVPWTQLAPGIRVHTVVGSRASFSYGEFDSGGVAPLHHHTREQSDVGISGVFDVTIGDRVEALSAGTGLIIPANVAHSIANRRGGTITAVEFHTVPRPDLVPPRPAATFPSSAEAVPPPTRHLVARLDSTGSGTTLVGETTTLRWRRLARTPIDLHPTATGSDVFVYLLDGDADLIDAGRTTHLHSGALVVIPAEASHVTLRPVDSRGVGLVAFALRP
ncbi:MAG TPA: cupin domain-containing protein [Gemmatimonadaceae bacterium]